MDTHGADTLGQHDEPEGGWVTAPDLIDTELIATVLCRFAGVPVSKDDPCPVRSALQHPDIECRAIYFQAEALATDNWTLEAFSDIPEEIRRPWAGGAPVARTHA